MHGEMFVELVAEVARSRWLDTGAAFPIALPVLRDGLLVHGSAFPLEGWMMAMVDAADIHEGMILRIDGKLWKVSSREARGTGQTSRVVHLRLASIPPGSHLERNLKSTEKIEQVSVERRPMAFLYRDGENLHFMDTESYEQIAIPGETVGPAAQFMREDMEIQVQFCEGQPVNVDFPRTVRIRVAATLPALHNTDTSAMKEATLENGMVVLVPQFIREDDIVELDVESGKYLSRVKG